MKKHEIIFSLLKIPLDFLTIFYSFYIARNIREINDFLPWFHLPTQNIANEYFVLICFIWSFFIFAYIFHSLTLYN